VTEVPRSFGCYEELPACDQVDVDYAPLPIALHAEWTIAALRAGTATGPTDPAGEHGGTRAAP
jgi:predicted dehydrogenase